MNANQVSSSLIPVAGKLPALSAANLSRLAVYLVHGGEILSSSMVSASRSVNFHVTTALAEQEGVFAVLGPKGLDAQTLRDRQDLPRVPLTRGHNDRPAIDFSRLELTDETIEKLWMWCREYTVSGTLLTSSGCPVPGSAVTVYNVSHGISGLVTSPRETVMTDVNGNFTATFFWCYEFGCWPCWPIWWRCWPWWWERDILTVIGQLEGQLRVQASSASQAFIPRLSNAAPLRRPVAADLMVGQGFQAASANEVFAPDTSRTALIASKLANPQLRAIFPWWWWCCENPNILFSATQDGNTILQEDPNISTRWCFASGQSVSLIANNEAIGLCPGVTPPPEGFAWSRVGNILVSDITEGYADGTSGTDESNMAFAGDLKLYGAFADPSVPFYQVLAGNWGGTGNPARGGTAPGAYNPLSIPMSNTVMIYRAATLSVEFDSIDLGPCSFGTETNLYMTTSQRPNPPSGTTGLGPFPILNPGDFILGWAQEGLIIEALNASALIGGAAIGGVSLSIAAYDATGASISLITDAPLPLLIDTTGFTANIFVNGLTAFDQFGTPVGNSTTSDCPSYHIGPNGYVMLHVNVTDPNGHLSGYEIDTQFGHGSTSVPTTPDHRGYSQSPGTFNPPSLPATPYGVDPGYTVPNTSFAVPVPPTPVQVSFIGGGDNIQIKPQVSCCYDFQLWAGKRVTDGESFFGTWGNPDFQTATIDVSPIV
jgi:hypothetical protein